MTDIFEFLTALIVAAFVAVFVALLAIITFIRWAAWPLLVASALIIAFKLGT